MPPETINALITIFTEVWKEFGDDIKKHGNKAWVKFTWEKVADKYARQMEKHYKNMVILGYHKPMPLMDIYVDVELWERPLSFRRRNREGPDYLPERKNAFELIQKEPNLFVLGRAGVGKTTLLQYLVLQAPHILKKIPILIKLRDLANFLNVVDPLNKIFTYIVEEFKACSLPDSELYIDKLLRSGKAIVLFDGLDELSKEQLRDQGLIQLLSRFVREYNESKFVITSRPPANDYQFPNFVYAEMSGFSLPQIEKLIKNWFGDNETASGFSEELHRPENAKLFNLAQNPLLLTLLCLLFTDLKAFPLQRHEVYEETLDSLLKELDDATLRSHKDIYGKLSLKNKKALFARIATKMFERGPTTITKKDLYLELEEFFGNNRLEVEDVPNAIEKQNGIMIQTYRDTYAFCHPIFQEFFAAYYFAYVEQDKLGSLMKHIREPGWREVFLLTSALLPVKSDFISSYLYELNAYLKSDPNDSLGQNVVSFLHWVDKFNDNSATYQNLGLKRLFHLYEVAFRTQLLRTTGSDLPNLDRLLDAIEKLLNLLIIKSTLPRLPILTLEEGVDADIKLSEGYKNVYDTVQDGRFLMMAAATHVYFLAQNYYIIDRVCRLAFECAKNLGATDLQDVLAKLLDSITPEELSNLTRLAKRLQEKEGKEDEELKKIFGEASAKYMAKLLPLLKIVRQDLPLSLLSQLSLTRTNKVQVYLEGYSLLIESIGLNNILDLEQKNNVLMNILAYG